MALLHYQSKESVNTGLDLFTVPPTQTAVEEGHFVEVFPLATLSAGSPIEFAISGQTAEYVDLSNTYLHIQVKLTHNDGSDLKVDDNVAPTNLFLHSLFSQVDVSLNGVLVTSTENTYPYRAMIETLLNHSKESQRNGLLQTEFFHNDTEGQLDDTAKGDANKNEGFKIRKNLSAGSSVLDLMGKLHVDLMEQDRFMINGVDIKFRLSPSKNTFSLMTNTPEKNYKAIITQASLFVRKARINPAIVLAHARGLEKANVKYPLKRLVCKNFSIPAGNLSCVQDNLFLTQIPNKLIVALVSSSAFNGSYTKNPFNFRNYNLSFISVSLDGRTIPAKGLTPNFRRTGHCARSYLSTLLGSGSNLKESGAGFTLSEFQNGTSLFCLDLSPSLIDGEQFELVRSGSLRLEMKFDTALDEAVVALVFGELDSMIEIGKSRQVMTDFSV